MSDTDYWDIGKPRKVVDPNREINIVEIDWSVLPSYEDYKEEG